MGSTGHTADAIAPGKGLAGRHYFPSAGPDSRGPKLLKRNPNLLAWAAGVLALRGFLTLFGI